MTKEEVKYLLKRYRFIYQAQQCNQASAFFTVGNRKERIEITESVKKFSNAVIKALEKSKDEFTRKIIESSIISGNSDVYVFSHFSISRGSYYTIKDEFFQRLFCLCICEGLVSQDEI